MLMIMMRMDVQKSTFVSTILNRSMVTTLSILTTVTAIKVMYIVRKVHRFMDIADTCIWAIPGMAHTVKITFTVDHGS